MYIVCMIDYSWDTTKTTFDEGSRRKEALKGSACFCFLDSSSQCLRPQTATV